MLFNNYSCNTKRTWPPQLVCRLQSYRCPDVLCTTITWTLGGCFCFDYVAPGGLGGAGVRKVAYILLSSFV